MERECARHRERQGLRAAVGNEAQPERTTASFPLSQPRRKKAEPSSQTRLKRQHSLLREQLTSEFHLYMSYGFWEQNFNLQIFSAEFFGSRSHLNAFPEYGRR